MTALDQITVLDWMTVLDLFAALDSWYLAVLFPLKVIEL